MRGILISVGIAVVLGVGGFVFLLMTADSISSDPEEVRVDVTDQLRE